MRIMEKISAWCYRVVNLPVLIVLTVIMFFFMILVLPHMAGQLSVITGVEVSPDTSFIYSADDLYAMAEAYGPAGRAYYVYSRFTFDLVWPAVYLFFLAASITYLFSYSPRESAMRKLNLLPFAGTFFDLLENSAASVVMSRYPFTSGPVALMTPLFTLCKWFFIALSFAALLAGLLLALSRFLKR